MTSSRHPPTKGFTTAGDGFVNNELNRGLRLHEQTIKQVDQQLEELDPDGKHTDYRDFVMVQILKTPRR